MDRRLTTILAADVAGFSRLIAADEEGTIAAQRGHREELIDPLLDEHGGRIANTAGDSLLIEFPSAVGAVRFAGAMQAGMMTRNSSLPENRRIEYRCGINVGDVVDQRGDLLGDGVNVAARLEALAPPGGIVISRSVRDQIRDRLDVPLADLEEVAVKNIARPVRAFQILREGEKAIRVPKPEHDGKSMLAAFVVLLAIIAGAATWWLGFREELPAEKPSVAVLAFDNLSGDPQQDFLSDGLSEDIIGALARFPQVDVIARNSSFAYKGEAVDIRQIADDLDVKFVLEGSVQRDGDKLRVTAQLIDASDGTHIWSRKYDRGVADIFDVKDDITRQILTEITTEVVYGERAYVAGRGIKSFEAWLLGHESYALDQTYDKANMLKALAMMEEALKIEPDSGQLHAWTGWRHARLAIYGYADDFGMARDAAERHALRAIELAPDLPDGYGIMGFVHRLKKEPELAIEVGQKAVDLAPGDATFLSLLAMYKRDVADLPGAMKNIEDAVRLNPKAPVWIWESYGEMLLLTERPADAVVAYERAVARGARGILLAECHLGIALAQDALGNEAEAREHVQIALEAAPEITMTFVSTWTYPEPQKTRRLEAWRRLGVPE